MQDHIHITEIRTEIVYRAEISTGAVLESSDSFRNLWKRAITELRVCYGDSLYFETGSARLSWGVNTSVFYAPGRAKGSYIEMRDLGEIRVFSMDHVTHTLYRKGDREYVL